MQQRFSLNALKISTGIFLLLLSACSSGGSFRSIKELAELEQADAKYRVNPGDTLSVKVWGEPKLSGDVFVREDGNFTLPLVKDVKASGLTLEEVGNLVTERLADFVPAASVSVSVLQPALVRYYLTGAFAKPGEYRSDGRITFLQAIATAGGFAPFANQKNITLIRKADEGEVRFSLNYDEVVAGKQPNPSLKTGDVIVAQQ